jgi:hypothetical protein
VHAWAAARSHSPLSGALQIDHNLAHGAGLDESMRRGSVLDGKALLVEKRLYSLRPQEVALGRPLRKR